MLRTEAEQLTVWQAKCCLMAELHLSERSAYGMMQAASKNRRLPMVQIAREVLEGGPGKVAEPLRWPRREAVPHA